MLRAITLLAVIILTTAAQAGASQPSKSCLADMGLAGLHVFSDNEASAIRGHGFVPGEHLDGFASHELSKLDFQEHVAAFRARIDSHTFRGAARFKASQERFHGATSRFQHKIH